MDRRDLVRRASLTTLAFGLTAAPVLAAIGALGTVVTTRAIGDRPRIDPWDLAILASALATAAWTGSLATLPVAAAGAAFFAVYLVIASGFRAVDGDDARLGISLGLAAHAGAAIWAWTRGGGFDRASGLAFHPNALGAVALIGMLVLADGVARRRRHGRHWGVPEAGVAVAALLLVLSGSRGAMIGAGVAVAVWIAAGSSEHRSRTVARTSLIAAAVLAVGLVGSSLLRPDVGSLNDANGRLELWSIAVEVAAQSPFVGGGVDAWASIGPAIEPRLDPDLQSHPHSAPLQILLTGGSFLLVAVTVRWTRRLRRLWRSATFGPAAAALMLGFTVHNLVDAFVGHMPLMALAFLGVLAARRPDPTEPSRESSEPGPHAHRT